jgi:hypothetical protein
MLLKLTPELISAAIAGLEEQRNRIDGQITDLRQTKEPTTTGASFVPTKGRRFSAAARKRMAVAPRKRWAERRAAETGASNATVTPGKSAG